jgi:hypothetical protein
VEGREWTATVVIDDGALIVKENPQNSFFRNGRQDAISDYKLLAIKRRDGERLNISRFFSIHSKQPMAFIE